MKKKVLISALILVLAISAIVVVVCCKKTTYSGNTDNGNYIPEEVESTLVETTRTDGVKYAEDALSGESFLYRAKGSDFGIVPNTNENLTAKIQIWLCKLNNLYTFINKI